MMKGGERFEKKRPPFLFQVERFSVLYANCRFLTQTQVPRRNPADGSRDSQSL